MSNIKTFFDEVKAEARVAAYCGYKDIADFRKFLISHLFLHHYLEYQGEWSQMIRKRPALELIRDRHLQGRHNEFPLDEPDKYHTDDHSAPEVKPKLNYRIAHILVIMVDRLSNLGETANVDDDVQKLVLRRLFKARPACATGPAVNGNVRLPILKRTSASKESALEPYNRAWALLKHFTYTSVPAIFRARFKAGIWDMAVRIDLAYVPEFMRPPPAGSPTVPPTPETARREPVPTVVPTRKHTRTEPLANTAKMRIRIEWLRKKAAPEERKALRAYFEQHGVDLDLPDTSQYSLADPRVYSQKQFRDSIRRQYKCEELGLQLSRARLMVPPSAVIEKKGFDVFTCDWDLLRRTLRTRFEKHKVRADVVVFITLRPLDEENDEELYEADEPSPRLDGQFASLIADDQVEDSSEDSDDL